MDDRYPSLPWWFVPVSLFVIFANTWYGRAILFPVQLAIFAAILWAIVFTAQFIGGHLDRLVLSATLLAWAS